MCLVTAAAAPSDYDGFLEWMSESSNKPIPEHLYDVGPPKATARNVEIEELIVANNLPKAKLLSSYSGREDALLKSLQKHSSTLLEIDALVEETNVGKSSSELLASFAPPVLAKNLRKMKSKQDLEAATVEEIKTLCDEIDLPKSSDELLESYAGKEKELLKYLQKMKAKQDEEAATLEEIEALVDELDLGKSSEAMKESYEGREEELLKQLRKMKAKNAATVAEIESLVASTNCGKSSEELLEKYKGSEKDLLKNLRRLNSSQMTVATSGTASVASLDASTRPAAPTKAKSYQQLIAEKKAAKKLAEIQTSLDASQHSVGSVSSKGKSYQQLIKEKQAMKKLAAQQKQ
ncbi:hypothetical protein ACHAXT_005595 [Thalassiosira profunda]